MTYNVKLENFEGPLDLLLFLVRKNEIDIENISIVSITQQYIEYIEIMQALNLDIAGDFLVMAATLMYLKSRALLPRVDEEESAEEKNTLDELKRQLLEYQQYKEAAQRLKEQNILEKDVFTRSFFGEPVPAEDDDVLKEASLFDLLSALKRVIARTDAKDAVMEISMELWSVKDKISEILQRLQDVKGNLDFEILFGEAPTRLEIITTFLAVLELIKMQAVKVYQNSSFSKIYLYAVHDEEAQTETPSPEQL